METSIVGISKSVTIGEELQVYGDVTTTAATINSTIPEYVDYVQAVQWKLVTIRVNVTEDRGMISDFEDVGGNDFTYLPFPAVINSSLESATGIKYKSSHPVISGLSKESTYIKGLNNILKTNKFGKSLCIKVCKD